MWTPTPIRPLASPFPPIVTSPSMKSAGASGKASGSQRRRLGGGATSSKGVQRIRPLSILRKAGCIAAGRRSARYKDRGEAAAARSGPQEECPAAPRWRAHCQIRKDSGAPYQSWSFPGNDYLLFSDEAFDPADEQSAVVMECLGFWRGIGAFHGGPIVVPELGNAIDLDIRRRNVRSLPLFEDM